MTLLARFLCVHFVFLNNSLRISCEYFMSAPDHHIVLTFPCDFWRDGGDVWRWPDIFSLKLMGDGPPVSRVHTQKERGPTSVWAEIDQFVAKAQQSAKQGNMMCSSQNKCRILTHTVLIVLPSFLCSPHVYAYFWFDNIKHVRKPYSTLVDPFPFELNEAWWSYPGSIKYWCVWSSLVHPYRIFLDKVPRTIIGVRVDL
jgi:hypothetical protein